MFPNIQWSLGFMVDRLLRVLRRPQDLMVRTLPLRPILLLRLSNTVWAWYALSVLELMYLNFDFDHCPIAWLLASEQTDQPRGRRRYQFIKILEQGPAKLWR